MKKNIFIKNLKSQLSDLDKKELARVSQYYEEYFTEMKINDNDEIDENEFDFKFLASEIMEDAKGGLKRKIEEFSYNDNDIFNIEESLKNPKKVLVNLFIMLRMIGIYELKHMKELLAM